MTASSVRRANRCHLPRHLLPLLLAVLVMCAAGVARADPPMRAARLAFVDGKASLSPAGDGQWYAAPLNRPLAPGDRLWTEQESSAEVQLGAATARVGPGSDLSVLDFDDRIAQFRLTQGTLRLRVQRIEPGQSYEIATPNLAFTVAAPGEYRVDVDAGDDSTVVMVRRGQARVDGQGNAYTIYEGRAYRFWGTRLRDQEEIAMPPLDGLEQWARERDQQTERAAAAAWVSPEVIGYQDLDAWGSWRTDAVYGTVWTPTAVATGWAPYVYGHWSWIAPWGWTWIDDAPWGFAVTHYGRWAHLGGRWCWVPGPARARAVYAPALVAFVGGPGFRLSASLGGGPGVAWFPLGPREVYQPPYRASRNYFTTINVTNTIVESRVVHEIYDGRTRAPRAHLNRNVPGAVVAMPERGFARGEPVRQAGVRLGREDLGRGQQIEAPGFAPMRPEPRGERDAGRAPPVRERPVITRNAAPAAPERPDRAAGELRPGAGAPQRPERVDRMPGELRPGNGAPPRPERNDRSERPGTVEPIDRSERPGPVERSDRSERPGLIDRSQGPAPVERSLSPSQPERPMRDAPRTRVDSPIREPGPIPQIRSDDGDPREARGRAWQTPGDATREERGLSPRFDASQPQPRPMPDRMRAPAAPLSPAPAAAQPPVNRAYETPRAPSPAAQRFVPSESATPVERQVPQERVAPAPRFAPSQAPQPAPRFAPQEMPRPAPRFAPQQAPQPAPQFAPQPAPRRFEPPQAAEPQQAPRQGSDRPTRREHGPQRQP